jgi:hypothetical protein
MAMNELRDRLRDESGMAMLWYGLTLVFVILVPCGLWLKTQPWSLEPEDQTQFFGLAAAHLAFALIMRATPGRLGLPRFLVTTSLGGVLCYLGARIVMSRLEVTVSRGSFMVGVLLS